MAHRRRHAVSATVSSAGLFLVLLHIAAAQRPQGTPDTAGGDNTQRRQQQLQLLLQQQQQQQRGAFRQRSRTTVVSDGARQRIFAPPPTRRPPPSSSSLFNPAQRRQNNPLFRNRRVNFLRPKTLPPPLPRTRPPPPLPTTQSSPPPPPPTETSLKYEEGVAFVSGENPALVTLGKHDASEDYSESVDELDDQGQDPSFMNKV